jgi:hypothetical protein
VRIAYADPPYFGLASYYAKLHPNAADYDRIETHAALIDSLADYDGWALSLHSPSLKHILPLCPATARVMALVARFAATGRVFVSSGRRAEALAEALRAAGVAYEAQGAARGGWWFTR